MVQPIVITALDHMDKNRDKSFTLIELIIVVAITILLSGLGLAAYNNFTQEKKLDSDVQKFTDVLELARKKAQSGDATECGSADSSITPRVEKYSVVVDSSSNYRLIANCPGATPTPISFQLDSSIQLQAPYQTVDFKSLSAVTSASCFILKNTSSSKCKYIKVESSGALCSGSCSCGSCVCPSC